MRNVEDGTPPLARGPVDDTVDTVYKWRLGRADNPDFGVPLLRGASCPRPDENEQDDGLWSLSPRSRRTSLRFRP